MAKQRIEVSGLWLRSGDNDEVEILLEIDGKWRKVISEGWIEGGVTSHIVEVAGIKQAPEAE